MYLNYYVTSTQWDCFNSKHFLQEQASQQAFSKMKNKPFLLYLCNYLCHYWCKTTTPLNLNTPLWAMQVCLKFVQMRLLSYTPEGTKEIFKQEFHVEKSNVIQRVSPVTLPYQLKTTAWDGTGFKESRCLLQMRNIPKVWSASKGKKDLEWWVEPDLGYHNCWPLAGLANQRVLFPLGWWANCSIQYWKPSVLCWDV